MTPGIGDLKGLIEVYTGCDIVTGEALGWWRWTGLIVLSELRHLRRLGYLDDVTEIGRFGEEAPLPPRGGTMYIDPEVGPRGAGDGYPPRSTLNTDAIRNIPGVVRGGSDLPNIYGQWISNGQGAIPGQIGRK